MRSGPRRQRNRQSRTPCASLPPSSRRRSIVDLVSVSSLGAARGCGIGPRPEPVCGDPSRRVGEFAYLFQPPAQPQEQGSELRADRKVDALDRALALEDAAARFPERAAVPRALLFRAALVLEPAGARRMPIARLP